MDMGRWNAGVTALAGIALGFPLALTCAAATVHAGALAWSDWLQFGGTLAGSTIALFAAFLAWQGVMRSIEAQHDISQSEGNEAWQETIQAFDKFISECNKHFDLIRRFYIDETTAHTALTLYELHIPSVYIDEIEMIFDTLSPSKKIIARKGIRIAMGYFQACKTASNLMDRSPAPNFRVIAKFICDNADELNKFASENLVRIDNHSAASPTKSNNGSNSSS